MNHLTDAGVYMRAAGFCFAAVCGLAIAGCTGSESKVIEVVSGGQVTVDNLRIGLGYVRKTKYTDDTGVERRGLVAGLWIFVKGDKSKNRQGKFYEGQQFQVDKYSLHVEKIRGGSKGSVRIRVMW